MAACSAVKPWGWPMKLSRSCTETALRRRVLKIETHRGRPVQEYDVWNRWFNLVDRSRVTDDNPFDD